MKANEERIEKLRENAFKRVGLYSNLFSTVAGKEVLADLEELFVNRTSIVSGDPYATHAREGAREVMLFIHGQIKLGANNEA